MTEGHGESAAPNMVPDRPVRSAAQDRFDFGVYAGVFANFFLHRCTATPMVVALSGPWGSGKTSLAHLIEHRLHSKKNWGFWADEPLTCWFNAWHHADAEKVGVALAGCVARMLAPRRRIWWRVLQPLPATLLMPAQRWTRRLVQGLLAALAAFAGLAALVLFVPELRSKLGPVGDLAEQGPNPVVLFAAASALIALAARAYKMGGSLGAYLESPQDVAAQGAVAEARENLGRLVRQALRSPPPVPGDELPVGARRLVIFIDDLERCPPEKALGVCETVTQLLDHPGVVVVLISDLAPIASAAAARYQNGEEGPPDVALGELYLDKLISMRFNLPPLSPESVGRLFARPASAGGGPRRGEGAA